MAIVSYYNPVLHGSLSPATDTAFAKSVTTFLNSLQANFNNWRLTIETRRQLRNLPDYLLDDIGITRYDIENSNPHS